MKRSVLARAAVSAAVVASSLLLMTATSVAASTLPTLTLGVTKNAVTVGGSEVSGAVDVVTTVTGEASDAPALILLNPGVTAAQLGHVVSSFTKNTPFDAIDPYATIVFDGFTAQGTPTTDQVVLPAGNYVAVNNGNGFTPFTVSPSATPASLPAPAATVSAIDFAFRGAATLHDGELVRFENDGWLIHMIAYRQAKSMADAVKAEKLLLAGDVGHGQANKYATKVQGQFAGPLSHGAMQQETITQPPGVYVIYCAMNAEDGRDHFQLGMYRTITIVK
ncbi:MAG: hypothetical protein ABSH51_13075 [Solirubrobacteraceae bacterium]|jgi:hypothetical protein